MKENFYIIIESMHYADRGETENVSIFQVLLMMILNAANKYPLSTVYNKGT